MLDTIEKGRVIFITLLALVGLVGFLIFYMSIDFNDPEKAPENIKKLTGRLVEESIPTEITWIQKTVNFIKNPFLLLVTIIGIVWLFGYFNKKAY